ncbi:filaggrin [Odocoileus virginianus]|uniref:Filaggrin n=1 Tax=Odocoileus virginianus TaxID=9874 RepID=A0A6J0YJ28_ODOVR
MSTLLENINGIIKIFHKYSKTDKETDTLSEKELKELLELEFRPILKNPDDPDTTEVFMHILDVDHNKKIDFTEFFLMVFKLAQAYYDYTQRHNLETAGQKQKKYTYHYEDEEDDTEEDKEETKRKHSHSRRSDGKNQDRSKSPRGRGKKRHGSKSGSKQRGGDSPTSGHRHGCSKKHHESRREKKRRSSSTELKERRHMSSVSPTRRYEEKEEECGYENKGKGRAKCIGSEYDDSYQVCEDQVTTNFQSSHNTNYGSNITKGRDTEEHSRDTGSKSVITHGRSGSSSRNENDSILTHTGDSSTHSESQKETHSESVHGRSKNTGQRQGSHHEQSRDSSRHSETQHAQTSTGSGSSRHSQSSVSQASDSEGRSEDSGRQSVTTHGRPGSSSRNQHGSAHGQARDSSRHSESHQRSHSDTVHEGQDPALDKGRGATMTSQETAPDMLEPVMDKPPLYPEAVGTDNPVLVRPVTVRAMQEIPVGILRQLMEGLVPAQGTNMDLSMDRQETVLGTQSPTKGATVNLSTKGLDPARGKDRGATMSSQETAPDTLGPVMDKPPLDPEAVDTGNPVLVRPLTAKDIQKTQVDSP